MAGRKRTPRVARRNGLVLVAAALWVVIIVVGAGSDAGDSLLGVDNLDVVWIVVFAITVLLSIAFVIYLRPFSGDWVPPQKKKRSSGVLLLAALVFGLAIWQPTIAEDLLSQEEETLVGGPAAEPEQVEDEAPPEVVAEATDILLLLVGVALIGVVWFLMRRQTSNVGDGAEHAGTALETDMVQALDRAARELDESTDPRTAVLRSYAVLETALASHGLTRVASETPTEHLRRALQNLRIDAGSVAQLGRLYEIARFSERPIAKAEQVAAADALRRAQTSLASLA